MIPRFRLHRPTTLEEAAGLLDAHGQAARAYAGGTELLLVLREGLLEIEHLVDLKRIPGLSGIRVVEDDGELEIGALATHTSIAESPLVREHCPALAAAEGVLGNRRVRNVGSIGGNLCFGEPHGDVAPVLVALGAALLLRGPEGLRRVLPEDWLLGPFEVDLRPAEILVAVRVPLRGQVLAYRRIRTLERPTVSVAVALTASPGTPGAVSARVVVGCAGPRPTRVRAAEDRLSATSADPQRVDAADVARRCGTAAADEVDAVDDLYGPETYKRRLVGVLVRRAVQEAWTGFGGRTMEARA
ncbi:MAG: FAD binding domain-containing protein [Chloroflexi bacterium]|nr:FAD binding domain-containing protein [Chloroflexota bacterium]